MSKLKFKDYFGKSLASGFGSAIGGIPSGIIGTGLQYLGNSLFNKQQTAMSKDLMNFQNAINRQNILDSPSLHIQGLKNAGISPSFSDGFGAQVASPSVPMPSTGTDTGYKVFDPFVSQQIRSLELDNERKEIENQRMLEEDKVARSGFARLAKDLGLDSELELDLPDGATYEPSKGGYTTSSGFIPLEEVKLKAGSGRNYGSLKALSDLKSTFEDIKRKGLENDLLGFQKFVKQMQIDDPDVLRALVRLDEKHFELLEKQIKSEASKKGLYDSQSAKNKTDKDYTEFIKNLQENTDVKALMNDIWPAKPDAGATEKFFRSLVFFFLASNLSISKKF